jgi:D-alanine-D-alanine ligase
VRARASGDLTLRVAILFNDDRGLEHGEVADDVAVQAVVEEVDGVEAACREQGWETARLAFDERVSIDADVVFNLVEGANEAAAARQLEAAGMPFTGSPSHALELALDKPATRAVLAAAGVPIPNGRVLERGDESLDGLRYPAIVKPAREDASHGMSRESVVDDEGAARTRARYVLDQYAQPALVEEFVAGSELGVAMLGQAEVLPVSEIAFSDGLRLLTYAAKWLPDTIDYASSPTVARDEIDPAIAAVARAAWTAIGLRDYGRVDVRLSLAGEPFVIDVNPNPDLTPGAGLSVAASRGGIDYAQLIAQIVAGALARGS